MPQCSSFSPRLDRPPRRSLRYPTRTSTRSIFTAQRSRVRPRRSAHPPLRRRSVRSIQLPQLRHLVCGAQIPIAPAAPPLVPPSRFPPLKVFVRRPPESAAPFVRGRHPKTFTDSERLMASKCRPQHPSKRTECCIATNRRDVPTRDSCTAAKGAAIRSPRRRARAT